MANQEQDTHAAGSGSSTGDPGKARGRQHPVHSGAAADDSGAAPVPPPAPDPNPPRAR